MKNKEEFKLFVEKFYQKFNQPLAFGICIVHYGQINNKIITLNYPIINFNENFGSFAVFRSAAGINDENDENEFIFDINEQFIRNAFEFYDPFIKEELQDKNSHKNISVLLELKYALDNNALYENGKSKFQFVAIYEDMKVNSIQSAYLKFHAISSGKAKLRSLNLDGIFSILDNLAWSGNKAYELEYLRINEISLKMRDEFPNIDYIDKFPRYLMQILPQSNNIRILDSANTRFGAFLGSGYVQMPGASYVNFNSGTLGACMNEGRISSSVVVGEGTDIGGGASILGVLSGGNSTPISIGANCLLGANSVTGISLGNGCIVDAGISVLSGTLFEIEAEELKKIKDINPKLEKNENNLYKGIELSGLHGIHFRKHSLSGKNIAFRSIKEIALNQNLH